MSEDKKMRVYKLISKNCDEYYIDYSNNKGYICMLLHNMISRYKNNGYKAERYKDYFYIISKNDVMIEELCFVDSPEEAVEYIKEYKRNNKGYVNGVDKDDYVFNVDVKCGRDKIKLDPKTYLKEYYINNKDRYKERYLSRREEILRSCKEKYVKKKKNID